jgi:hypothetical protein
MLNTVKGLVDMSERYDRALAAEMAAGGGGGEGIGPPPPGYIRQADRAGSIGAYELAVGQQTRRGPEATQAAREANDRRRVKLTPEQRKEIKRQEAEGLAIVAFNNAMAMAKREIMERREAAAAAIPVPPRGTAAAILAAARAPAARAPPPPPPRFNIAAAEYKPPADSVAASIDRFNASAAAPAVAPPPPRRALTQAELDAITYAPEGRRTNFLKPDNSGEGHYRGCGIARFDERCYFN